MAWGYHASSYAATPTISAWSASGETLALGATPSSGDRIIVHVASFATTGGARATLTVTDNVNAGNYTEDYTHAFVLNGFNARVSVFSHANVAASATTVKVVSSPSGSGYDGGFQVAAYSGLLATDPGLDVASTGATGTGATATSDATTATNAANELALSLYNDEGENQTLTSGTGWTQRGSHGGDPTAYEAALADKDSGSSGATPNGVMGTGIPTGGQWHMVTVVYQLAGGGAAGNPPGLGPTVGMTEPLMLAAQSAMMR